MNKIKYLAAALTVIAGLGFQQAKADSVSYFISVGNPALSGFSGPYAQVTITTTSANTATVTFTSLTNSGNIFLMAGQGAVGLNVNAASFSLGSVTGTNAGTGFSPGPYSNGGANNEDGFGSFNLTVDSFDGFMHSADSISFTLTNNSGTWGSAANVLIANGSGYVLAIHGFVTASPANSHGRVLATGYAANGPMVPDGGATVMLLGVALGALGMARRYLKT